MVWFQHSISYKAPKRGCHLITPLILNKIQSSVSKIKIGLAHFFVQHTSCGITINENYDSDVRIDMETSLNRIVPEDPNLYRHTMEGADDMPAHVKTSLIGNSITIPITDGKLNLGTWQGIWLCEFRDYPTTRHIIITIQGE